MPPQLSSSPPTYLEDVKKLFTAPSRPLVRSLAVRSVRIRIASSQRGAAPIELPLKVRPALILLNALDLILLGLLGFHPASSRVVPINDKVLHFVAFFLASLLFYSIWDVPSTTRRTSVLYRYLPLALSFFVCFFVGGVGSEFVQSLLPYKTFDWGDIVANLLGSTLGLWVSFHAERRYRLDQEMRSQYRSVDVEEVYDDLEDGSESEEEGGHHDERERSRHGMADVWSAADDDIYSAARGGGRKAAPPAAAPTRNSSSNLFSIDDDEAEEAAPPSPSIRGGVGQEGNVWKDGR